MGNVSHGRSGTRFGWAGRGGKPAEAATGRPASKKRRTSLLRQAFSASAVPAPAAGGTAAGTASMVYSDDHRRRRHRLHHHHVLQNEDAWSVVCSTLSWKMLSIALAITLVIYVATVIQQSSADAHTPPLVQADNHGQAVRLSAQPAPASPADANAALQQQQLQQAPPSQQQQQQQQQQKQQQQIQVAANQPARKRAPSAPSAVAKGCSVSQISVRAEAASFVGCGLEEGPAGLEQLKRLRLLDLGGNRLQHVPTAAASLPALEVLFLSNNDLTVLHAKALGAASMLRVLSLKSNKLRAFDAQGLPLRLEQLILTDNELTAIADLSLRRTHLRKIMLTRNRLQVLPRDFTSTRTLELARLSHNQLNTLPRGLFSMPRLCWLALAGNPVLSQPDPSHQDGTISMQELELGEKLGEGTSGVVHHGVWHGREVAVKMFKAQSSDGSFWDEMAVARLFHHPNITTVHGTIASPQPGLVLELLSDDFQPLASPPNAWTTLRCTYARELSLSPTTTTSVLHALASALAHVHEHKVAHGDIYAHNILFNRQTGAVKLSDFGASWVYAALPAAQHPLVQRQEVRAFGILLSELVAHTRFTALDTGVRRALAEAADACTQPLVNTRPSFAELASQLHALSIE